MLIPIRTDYRQARRPVVNYAIIALNMVTFLFWQGSADGKSRISLFLLDPLAPQLYQFFTCMFLHADWAHIIGNMIFLWVFGNAVNDRFGHMAYAAFYLAGGVLSGIGYVLLSGHMPVLGASGAIAGVTGCYLVLLPRVRVTLLVLFWMLLPIEISSLYFLGIQFLFNIWASVSQDQSGVAYVAHAVGYVYGITVTAGMLALGLLPRDVYDLLSLWKARRRRAAYRRVTASGYDPFIGPTMGREQPPRRRVAARQVDSTARTDTAGAEAIELRRKISEAHARGDYPTAAAIYLQLVAMTDEVVLPRQQQLDIGNHLMSEQRYHQAADAYERLLKFYPNYEHSADIRLMLGIIYSRYLKQKDLAEENLRLAMAGLRDSNKLAMARAESQALGQE
ncbi:MAG: rhomboid family intramembrane serine protease [Planctomycetes bacterium]|nr:rhomboid family intramembrane serine protease [Planctomycetota bacterium]